MGFGFGEALSGATLLGGMVSAMGGISTGNAQKHAAYYNAARDRQAATLAEIAGREDAQLIRLQAERTRAQGLANMAAAGVDISTGSPILAAAQAAKYAEVDAAKAQYAGDLKAWGLRSDAQIEQYTGQQAQTQSRWNAAGGLLQSTAQAGYLAVLSQSHDPQYTNPFGVTH